jgi:hypothetical protein
MEKAEDQKVYKAKKIVVNGEVSSEALSTQLWQRAAVLSDFSFPWTQTKAPETLFRALWDDENFYFRFEVEDAEVVLA